MPGYLFPAIQVPNGLLNLDAAVFHPFHRLHPGLDILLSVKNRKQRAGICKYDSFLSKLLNEFQFQRESEKISLIFYSKYYPPVHPVLLGRTLHPIGAMIEQTGFSLAGRR